MTHSEISSRARIETLRRIRDKIQKKICAEITVPPEQGMVMVKHVDPVGNTQFYLGEAYVTVCEVSTELGIGYGCVLGKDEERAHCAALIDLAFGVEKEISETVKEDIEEEERYIVSGEEAERARIMSTRVRFETRPG